MRIGIDIDDTVANTNECIIERAILYDKVLNNKGIKDNRAYNLLDIFYWTKEEKELFLKNNFESIISNVKVKNDACKYINMLKNEGHEIVFITYRSYRYISEPYLISKKWLDSKGFKYDKLIANSGPKGKVCVSEKIDLFIDDNLEYVTDVVNNGVRCLLMDTSYNKDSKFNRVYNFKEVYDIIKEENNGR